MTNLAALRDVVPHEYPSSSLNFWTVFRELIRNREIRTLVIELVLAEEFRDKEE